jgi:hypothetical protein
MDVKVNKSVFEQLIKKFVNEHSNSRTTHSVRIDQIAGDELPVLPNEHMPLQLSSEMPNVADEDYMPTTTSALSDAAATIAKEVPDDQVEFFYNQLHNLLKSVMDREEEARIPMMEALLFEAIDGMEDNMTSLVGDKDGWKSEEEGIDDVEQSIDRDQISLVTAESVAQAIIDKGYNVKDAIHDKTDTMNLDISNVKSSSENFASFGHKPKKITLPPRFSNNVLDEAIEEDEEIKTMFVEYIKEEGITTATAYIDVLVQLAKKMEKLTEGMTLELASQTHANITYDKLKKTITGDDVQTIEEKIDEEIEKVKNGPSIIKIHSVGIDKIFEVPSDMFIAHLEDAKNRNDSDPMSKSVADEEFGSEEEKDEAIEDIFDIDKAEKRLETNLDNQSDLFGFAHASGILQWFKKHPEQKFVILVKGASDMGGEEMNKQTFSALEALIMSPGVEKWIKKIRKKAPKGLRPKAVEKVISGIEAIINDVTTGDEEIDFDKLKKTSAGWIVRAAFDKLLLGKTFGTFYNHRENFSKQLIAHLDIDKKLRLSIVNMLAGITTAPTWDKAGTPLSRNAEKVIEAGITIEMFKNMLKEVAVEIEGYFDDNITDIKSYYNKQLQNEGSVVSAFDRAVADIRDNVVEMMAEKDVQATLDAERQEQQQ